MNFKASEEQELFLDFVKNKLFYDDSITAIGGKAFAGCGKSTLLKQTAKQNKDIQMLGLAFNNGIVKSNTREFPKRNTTWYSLHQFAEAYLKKFNVNIDFSNRISRFKPLELVDILDIKNKQNYDLANAINEVMKVYCQSSLEKINPASIKKAATAQINNTLLALDDSKLLDACLHAKKLWELMESNRLPVTFDFYLKFFEVNHFAEKINDFQLLALDEAQDSNAVTMSIVTQMPTKNIYVGDEHQSIYGFRGTLNAMQYVDKLFYLSTTYRYTQEIADYANRLLFYYKNEKVPIKSFAGEKTKTDGIHAFLSRNNSSMISLIDEFVENNVFFKTIKNPDELFATSIALLKFCTDRTVTDKNFLYLKNFQDKEALEEYIAETNDVELQTAFGMQQRFGKRLYSLLIESKNNFKSKSPTKHVLSTAHSAKGLEWDKVELLKDFPNITTKLKEAQILSPKDLLTRSRKNDYAAHQIIQEINLKYVAVTRARYEIFEQPKKIKEDE